MSSAASICKQFGPRSDPTKHWASSGFTQLRCSWNNFLLRVKITLMDAKMHTRPTLYSQYSESDCRFRGHEFNPDLVPYFRGDWSWNNIYGHYPSSAESRRVVVSYKRKYVHNVLVNLAQEKVWLGELIAWHDHSCWLGHKTTNKSNKSKNVWL